MRIFQNLQVDWMGKRKIFYIISGSIFVLGMLNIIFRGLALGIDFKGGTELELKFQKPVNIGLFRDQVQGIGLGAMEVKTFGGETGVLIRTQLQALPPALVPRVVSRIKSEIDAALPGVPHTLVDSSAATLTFEFLNPDTTKIILDKLQLAGMQASRGSDDLNNKRILVRVGISDYIKDNLREKYKENSFSVLRAEIIGPKIGKELKTDALIAVGLSLLGILIYLGFRFKFIFAVGAVVALFHDTLITLGLFSLLYGLIPGLNLEIDVTIVGAFLTLIGYSVNDTVIVFDRVRETIKVHKNQSLFNLLNESINKTMSRTVLTGGTTLLSIFVLLIFGGDVLRSFAFTLFFGIIIGTYSSIFVASAIVLDYAEKSGKKVEF